MADVVSHNETDREGKGSNKYLLSTHHMPGAMVIMDSLEPLRALYLEQKDN